MSVYPFNRLGFYAMWAALMSVAAVLIVTLDASLVLSAIAGGGAYLVAFLAYQWVDGY